MISLNDFLLKINWLVPSRWKISLTICCWLLFLPGIFCQCPPLEFFKRLINVPLDTKNVEKELGRLLQLQQQMITCHFDKDSSFMYLLQRVGVLYFSKDDYSHGIRLTRQSIALAEYCISNHTCTQEALVRNYFNIYYYSGKAGRLEEKSAAIDRCISYAIEGKAGYDFAIKALYTEADYLFNKGDYSLCYQRAKTGEDLTIKYCHDPDSINYIISFIINQANYLNYAKEFSTAEKLLEIKITEFIRTGNGDQLASFYNSLGTINKEKRDYPKALDYFQKAYQANLKDNVSGCAQNLDNIGSIYAQNLNRPDEGLKYCFRALTYADPADSLSILRQIGSIYVLKKAYDKAQIFFQQAFNTVKPGMNESTMLQNIFQFPGFNQLQEISGLLTEKGDAYLQQYYHSKDDRWLKKALDIYRKGDQFLGKIKNEQRLQEGSNLVWRTTARNLYEHAIEACYAANNIEQAFYFFEKSRAVSLNDQINQQKWMGDADIAKQAHLKKTLLDLEKSQASLSPSSDEYISIQNKLATGSQELNTLIQSIRLKNPLFYQEYLDTVFMTVTDLRKNVLQDKKSMVEIFSGDSAVYVLTITPAQHTFTRINKEVYDSLTHLFNLLISDNERLDKNFTSFVGVAQRLQSLLFPHHAPPPGSLIISPDGISYPFEALVINDRGAEPDYFLQHYAISYTYSAKYLTHQFADNTNSVNHILGVAPVQYKSYPGMGTLNGSDQSLQVIDKYFGGVTSYLREQATRDNFLQHFPNFNIIQLYTHAADSSDRNDPVIYFSDAKLYLSELLVDRKPITQLVVLSACETANGKWHEGEGVFSFNRGFATLGIPAAVSNLWSVDNVSTYRITELFYKYLAQGLPTDIALQKAKLEFLNDNNSEENKMPFFWAGPILTGKVNIIQPRQGFSWKIVLPSVIVLLGLGYFIFRSLYKKGNKKTIAKKFKYFFNQRISSTVPFFAISFPGYPVPTTVQV